LNVEILARDKLATKRRSPKSEQGETKGTAPERAARPSAGGAAARPARPRIRASHAHLDGGGPAAKTKAPRPKPSLPTRPQGDVRKAPLAAPRRPGKKRSVPPPALEASRASRELSLAIAAAGLDKKALGIEILDVVGRVDYADFIVVMTGRSDRHVQAIASGIEEALRPKKIRALSVEGLTTAQWVLIDFSDVVVHVFQEDSRRLYDIEGLWIDADRVPVKDGPADAPPSPDLT
jgi:ribosome-associated protein